ncbi:MAG: sigma-70 family RNA polymerase sigma factor [Clostridia bacterium]|nr:sigma-70 family RNA polymerase sigma factor [Clostridia bacterium]
MDVVKGPDSKEALISQWINDWEKDLLRLCCVYLKDVSLAEDAVQETFLKAYKNLHTFRGDASAKTWLVRISINVCKDMRRTAWFRSLKNAITLDKAHIPLEDGSVEIRSDLAAAVMGLPAVLKEAVLLHDYEGFSQTEIAQTLGISVPTVHRRLKKAYALMKDVLKGDDVYEA